MRWYGNLKLTGIELNGIVNDYKEDEQIVDRRTHTHTFILSFSISTIETCPFLWNNVYTRSEHRRNLYDFIWINCVANLNSHKRKKKKSTHTEREWDEIYIVASFVSLSLSLSLTVFNSLFRLIYRLVLSINAYILSINITVCKMQ